MTYCFQTWISLLVWFTYSLYVCVQKQKQTLTITSLHNKPTTRDTKNTEQFQTCQTQSDILHFLFIVLHISIYVLCVRRSVFGSHVECLLLTTTAFSSPHMTSHFPRNVFLLFIFFNFLLWRNNIDTRASLFILIHPLFFSFSSQP